MADKKTEDKSSKKGGVKPDLASFLGVVIALGGIIAGLLLEGGKMHDISQFTAGLIVLGGTIGAVMITNPMTALLGAAKRAGTVFLDRPETPDKVIEEIIEYATQARKQGIVSLEQKAATITDPFLRKALMLAVDGIELSQIRSIMELEITIMEQDREAEAKVFEAAGGYSPTVGIIGAVLGLIQVMKHLADIEEVGKGIAVAFVATVYGVAVANLLFLPIAAKLNARTKAVVRTRELMLEGVLSIVEGLNPKLIHSKLEGYIGGQSQATAKGKKAKDGAKQVATPVSAEG